MQIVPDREREGAKSLQRGGHRSLVGGRFGVPLLACLLMSAAFGGPALWGQAGDDDPQLVNRVLMLAPREYQQQLKQAEEAIERQQYSEAIEQLMSLLLPAEAGRPADEGVREDFFIGQLNENRLHASLRSEARRLLASLPTAGLELYRLQFGAIAQQRLNVALDNHDVDALAEVATQYFHTEAGQAAALLLGRHQLDAGYPLAAAMSLARLHAIATVRDKYDPELSVQLASAWQSAGMSEQAEQVLVELQRRLPQAKVRVAGTEVALFSSTETPLASLARLVPAARDTASTVTTNWQMHRGSPGRNPLSAGGLPLRHHRWLVPLANNPDDESLIATIAAEQHEQQTAAIPALTPLIVNDVVLMRTSEQLLAIDFKTGKRIWEYPWAEPVAVSINEEVAPSRNRQQRRNQLEERVWFDRLYGQLASDGRRLFLVDDLTYVSAGTLPQTAQLIRNFALSDPTQIRDHNSLVALDIQTQGKFRWRVGGATGEDEPTLAGAFFLGAPLVVDGDLYVLAELRSDINLYVLDAETGRLRWSQLLAHVGPQSVVIDNLRRFGGATPSYSDGVVICPTGAGAVVAVDLAQRSLLWGFQYPRGLATSSGQAAFFFNGNPLLGARFGARPTLDRWLDGAPVIADGKVFISPLESNQLFCLDLLQGEVRWQIDREDEFAYVACVHQDKLVLVGRSRVSAFNVNDGARAWELPLGGEASSSVPAESPAGQGFVTADHHYYLPTNRRLLQIRLDSGELVSAVPTGNSLGNLVCYRDQVVSLSPTNLSTFYQSQRLEQEVADRLAAQPNDAWALEHRGLLLLEAGQTQEALPWLRQAFHAYAANDDRRVATQTLLVDTLLAVMEGNPAEAAPLVGEVDQLIDQPGQRERFLRFEGRRLLAEAKPDLAFAAYLELAAHRSTPVGIPPQLATQLTLLEDEQQQLSVRRDRLVRAGLRESWRMANATQRATMEAVIRQELSAALAAESVGQLQDFLRAFADHPLAHEVRLELAARYLSVGQLLLTEQLVSPLLTDSAVAVPTELAARAWVLYGRAMKAAGRSDLTAVAARQLVTRWPDMMVAEHQNGRSWSQRLLADLELGGVPPDYAWPYGRIDVEEQKPAAGNVAAGQYQMFRPVWVEDRLGAVPSRLQVYYDAMHTNSLIICDDYGNEQVRLPGTVSRAKRFVDGTLTCRSLGHLVLINYGYGLVATNALRPITAQESPILWPVDYTDVLNGADARSTPISPEPRVNDWGQNQLRISGRRVESLGPLSYDGIVYLQAGTLICADPLTGDPLWIRPNFGAGLEVWGDDEQVYVAGPTSNSARVFRLLDGAELGTRSIPAAERRWTTTGRHILTWADVPETHPPERRLQLYDPWTEQPLWSRDLPADARGYVTADKLLAVVDPQSQVLILEISTGKELLSSQLQSDSRQPRQVYLLTTPEQFLVVRSFDIRAPRGVTLEAFPDATVAPNVAPMIDGDVTAFARVPSPSTPQQPQWQTPAIIEGYSLPLDQPARIPVLSFVRQISKGDAGRRGRGQLELLCIDKRDGRIVWEKDKMNLSYGAMFASGTPADNTVTIRLPNAPVFQLKLTQEPHPPAPAAQTGSAASRIKGAGLTNIMEAIIGAAKRAAGAQDDEADLPEENPPADGPNGARRR